jgi:hypothetical protein
MNGFVKLPQRSTLILLPYLLPNLFQCNHFQIWLTATSSLPQSSLATVDVIT